jgi:methylmalonyl-CoA mutase
VDNLKAYQSLHDGQSQIALDALQRVVLQRDNSFTCLMEAAKCCSLGQMSGALYQVGGLYRRNM